MILSGTPIHAVIFDMDGVLIDSEPLWKIAEIAAFDALGIRITTTELEQTVGLRIDEVVDYWCQQKGKPLSMKEEIITKIMSEMVRLIFEKGEPLAGVCAALDYFKNAGVKIGLATSSYEVLLNATLKKLGISHFF
jgi:sugar-phosphatase